MTYKLSSSVSSATLVAINYSISAATVAADDKQNHHKQTKRSVRRQILDNAKRDDRRLFTPKSSIALMKPDVGILSKDFLKTKDREQTVDKQFAIHQKKRAAVDVDVGILSNGRRQQQTSRVNLHDKNKVTGRSLQSEGRLPWMCPDKNGDAGSLYHVGNLFNETDGYFPKCSCPNPTTCGPDLCECLELDADGDILQCMDSLDQLCEGTQYIDGVPGPWSMEGCLGSKFRAIAYCSMLPCFVDGDSWWQCACNFYDSMCREYRDKRFCAGSKCCQAQTDDEGREACLYGGLHQNYYDEDTSFSISYEEMISRFNECSFNSDDDKSIVQCYCESFSYGLCVNYGVANPDICEAMNCCFGETKDDARLDCFTNRFRVGITGGGFHNRRDIIQESCVASGKSSDQCKCDIHGLSYCVSGVFNVYDSEGYWQGFEPRCDLFQCCQLETGDDDDGRKDCLVRDEAQLRYETCINNGNTTESCVCDKSNTLCVSGHSNDLNCELSSCCQKQSDGVGWKECIGNFTTSQPSSAPSESTPAENSIDDAEASPSAASTLPGTSSASISTSLDLGVKPLAKTTSKMLAVTASVIGWLLFS